MAHRPKPVALLILDGLPYAMKRMAMQSHRQTNHNLIVIGITIRMRPWKPADWLLVCQKDKWEILR